MILGLVLIGAALLLAYLVFTGKLPAIVKGQAAPAAPAPAQ